MLVLGGASVTVEPKDSSNSSYNGELVLFRK